ncbi:hypothetical protein COF09_31565 [Bacillus toyonensis]|uniref:hypothetical protein n=1 Tax=Bacillus toyonensis TaxID=155322 RepID=UPI000BFDD42D|nr:hypothetical protein [Bacillus toyonensis]PHC35135.1 hypothetical protein COF09_31565 [Bacillus toyonensis]
MNLLKYFVLLYAFIPSFSCYNEKQDVEPCKDGQPTMQNTAPAKPLQKVLYTGPIEHLFFHPLIAYPQRAFKKDYQQNSMDDWFVTVAELNNILRSLYDKHFILVNIQDIYEKNIKNGKTFIPKKNYIFQKEKNPIVLSIDDVNYYPYMKKYGVM